MDGSSTAQQHQVSSENAALRRVVSEPFLRVDLVLSCWVLRGGESPVAQPDVSDLASSCGVQAEQHGSGPGYFGSGGILLLKVVVCRRKFSVATHEYPFKSR